MEKKTSLAFGLNGNAAEEQRSFLFVNPSSWENSADQNDPFESALSSMVSSPVTSSAGGGGEENVLRELIGRLGSICNSGEISPHSYSNVGGYNKINSSANTSCYGTPSNSPSKLNLSIMDHQIRGNSPISGSHLAANPSLVAPFISDQGYADRAARYSCFANKNLGGLNGQISGVSSYQSIKIPGSQMDIQDKAGSLKAGLSASDKKMSKFSPSSTPENSEFGDSVEISSLTEQITAGENVRNDQPNPRKRKSIPKGKAKEPTSLNSSKDANGRASIKISQLKVQSLIPCKEAHKVQSEKADTNAKRSKSQEDNAEETDGREVKAESNGTTDKTAGDGNKKHSKDNNAKPPEPPKDYIHVRARRGQATDAHSLAERVRREKISERMKLLQDLVPGCTKVTGKAVMLDEIINYVQSLQRQVEFLSMKLATFNPRSDFTVEAPLSKDVIQSQGPLHHNIYPADAAATEFPYPFYPPQGPNMQSAMPNGIEELYSMNHLNAASGRITSIQLPASDNFGEVQSQAPAFWGDDLHTVVQMGLGQNQSQNLHGGIMFTAQMKVEH